MEVATQGEVRHRQSARIFLIPRTSLQLTVPKPRSKVHSTQNPFRPLQTLTPQSYFEYRFLTLCGIPAILLEGTVEDWEDVHRRVEGLVPFDLGWWIQHLLPITEEFVKAAKGTPTVSFWRGLYKDDRGSGGPYLTGWLLRLLPYLKRRETSFRQVDGRSVIRHSPWRTDLRNPLLESTRARLKHDQLPSSASMVPFVWVLPGREMDYQFVAGTLTIAQNPDTKTIRPRVGWAVRPAPAEETSVGTG